MITPAWYLIWLGCPRTKYQRGDIAPRPNTWAVFSFRAIYQDGVICSRSNTRIMLSCLDQIPGRCYLYQDCVIIRGRKTRIELPHPDQIRGRGSPLQTKYQKEGPLLDQLPGGVVSNRAVLSFRSEIPDRVTPSDQIPEIGYAIQIKYQVGVIF